MNIYYKDGVLLNIDNVSKIDCDVPKTDKGYPIKFYNSDVKVITQWIFESKEERSEVEFKLRYVLEAKEL